MTCTLCSVENWLKTQVHIPWWHHQMETFSALLALCLGNSPVSGQFPAQKPVTRISDVFFDLCPNKRLSKQPWGWWFETQSCSLWRHCNVMSLKSTCWDSWSGSYILKYIFLFYFFFFLVKFYGSVTGPVDCNMLVKNSFEWNSFKNSICKLWSSLFWSQWNILTKNFLWLLHKLSILCYSHKLLQYTLSK